jgi:Zn-dependent alcohol dehydrogenase
MASASHDYTMTATDDLPTSQASTRGGVSARVVVARQHQQTLELREIVLPAPQRHQVVVELLATGVCHSQLHQLRRPRATPLVLGHEGVGTVSDAGSAVAGLTVGDAVLVTWIPRDESPVRHPEWARVNLEDGSVAGAPNGVFTWADATIVDEQYVVKIPRSALVPESCVLACAVMTGAGAVRNTARVGAGQSTAIFGVGGVGLSAIAAARLAGAAPIIAVDLSDEKLNLAKRFGATDVVNASRQDPVERILGLTRHPTHLSYSGDRTAGVDFAFDCIGLRSTMSQAVASARRGVLGAQRGGTAVLVGAPEDSLNLNVRDVLVNEKRFVGTLGGSARPARDFQTYAEWIANGDLDLDALVSDRFALDEVQDALTKLQRGDVMGRAILLTEHAMTSQPHDLALRNAQERSGRKTRGEPGLA